MSSAIRVYAGGDEVTGVVSTGVWSDCSLGRPCATFATSCSPCDSAADFLSGLVFTSTWRCSRFCRLG